MEGPEPGTEFASAIVVNGKVYELTLPEEVKREVQATAEELGITYDELIERIASSIHNDMATREGEPNGKGKE